MHTHMVCLSASLISTMNASMIWPSKRGGPGRDTREAWTTFLSSRLNKLQNRCIPLVNLIWWMWTFCKYPFGSSYFHMGHCGSSHKWSGWVVSHIPICVPLIAVPAPSFPHCHVNIENLLRSVIPLFPPHRWSMAHTWTKTKPIKEMMKKRI